MVIGVTVCVVCISFIVGTLFLREYTDLHFLTGSRVVFLRKPQNTNTYKSNDNYFLFFIYLHVTWQKTCNDEMSMFGQLSSVFVFKVSTTK